jgi:hypothetical protein
MGGPVARVGSNSCLKYVLYQDTFCISAFLVRAFRIRVCLQAYRKWQMMNAPLGAGFQHGRGLWTSISP